MRSARRQWSNRIQNPAGGLVGPCTDICASGSIKASQSNFIADFHLLAAQLADRRSIRGPGLGFASSHYVPGNCPLVHGGMRMSPLGQTLTSADVCGTTASPPKADMPSSRSDVAEVPGAD